MGLDIDCASQPSWLRLREEMDVVRATSLYADKWPTPLACARPASEAPASADGRIGSQHDDGSSASELPRARPTTPREGLSAGLVLHLWVDPLTHLHSTASHVPLACGWAGVRGFHERYTSASRRAHPRFVGEVAAWRGKRFGAIRLDVRQRRLHKRSSTSFTTMSVSARHAQLSPLM
jgi:hypothetical protein